MSEYKTEIGMLDPGSRFYFPNDPDKNVWTVLDSKRKAATGPLIYIYCEDDEGKVIDYNSNRSVMGLRGNSGPHYLKMVKKKSRSVFTPPPQKKSAICIKSHQSKYFTPTTTVYSA